jgi:hypothetical protein
VVSLQHQQPYLHDGGLAGRNGNAVASVRRRFHKAGIARVDVRRS